MVITNSQVNMGGRRDYRASSYAHTSYMSWDNSGRKTLDIVEQDFRKESGSPGSEGDSGFGNLSFSDSMDDIYEKQMNAAATKGNLLTEKSNSARLTFLSLNYLFHWLFGKHYYSDSEWEEAMSNALSDYQPAGGQYSFEGYRSESEITTFTTKGTVTTADGRNIDFNINLSMTRAFEEYYSEAASWGAALNQANLCDPLVINLDGGAATVTDQSFLFDIDCDGTMDNISMATGNSGFLALDKNGDGIINNGSELFGTESGDGFADLAAYDEDHNGWIDEADSVFAKLMVYSKAADGSDKLISIGKAGVGAIYLGNENTDFALKSGSGNTNAFIRKTGIFLYENGGAGTIQHLDVAKK